MTRVKIWVCFVQICLVGGQVTMDLSFWRSSNWISPFGGPANMDLSFGGQVTTEHGRMTMGSSFSLSAARILAPLNYSCEHHLASGKAEWASSNKDETCKFMKLEVCKCGESVGCGPISNVMSRSIFSPVLCGACHMLLDHFPHKHKCRSPKVTYNQAFWILFQATSTVLVAKDRPLLVSSHFVVSIGTLLDPSSNVGCHCRRLNRAILWLMGCQCFSCQYRTRLVYILDLPSYEV